MKKYLYIVIGTALFIAFIYKTGFKEISDAISLINIALILLVIFLNFPILYLKTVRWKFLLLKFNISYPFINLFGSISAGFFLGLVTPGTVGELGRALTTDLDKTKGFGTVIFEKIFDLFSLLLLAVSSLVFYFLPPVLSVISVMVVIFISSTFFYFISTGKIEFKFVTNLFRRSKSSDKLSSTYHIIIDLFKDINLVVFSLIISFSLWLISAIQFYIILRALNIIPSVEMVFICYFLPYILGIISFIPLGLGIFDFSMAGTMTTIYSISEKTAYSAVAVFRILATFFLVLLGYFFYLYKIHKVVRAEQIKLHLHN